MRKKRFLAVALAASMVLGSSVSAFASAGKPSDGSSATATKSPAAGYMTGKAQVEGYLDKDIFKVEVPTVSVNKSIFNFVMDPQGLIESTNGARYTNNKGVSDVATSANQFEYGTLYFANVSGNTTKLSPSSDAVTITNKSTFDVDATLTADITELGGLSVSTNIAAVTDPSIELSLSGNDGSAPITPTGAASLSTTISGCDADYVTSFNTSSNAYEYALSSNSGNFADYSFRLTGASGGGDYVSWNAISKQQQKPTVKVTWNIVPHVDPVAPSITDASTTYSKPATGGVKIKINLGAGNAAATGIASISKGAGNDIPAANYSYADGVLTIKRAELDLVSSATTYTITFNDSSDTTVTFTINP